MTGPLMGLLLLGCGLGVATTPPTLPHVHHAGPHPAHLDLNTVKGVMESIEKMWHDYTALSNRSGEMEARLASTEERLTSASRVCDVEKAALEQVHEVRVSRLERRLHALQQHQHNDTSCPHDQQHHLATIMLRRLDNIWNNEAMENVALTEKSRLTNETLEWARTELAREPAVECKKNKKSCDGNLDAVRWPAHMAAPM